MLFQITAFISVYALDNSLLAAETDNRVSLEYDKIQSLTAELNDLYQKNGFAQKPFSQTTQGQ